MFRLALAQINPVVGDLDGNVELIRDLIEKVEHCDLAVFGEMSLTGYPLEDLVLKPGFITDNKNALHDLASMSGNCALVIGFADSDEENVYNSIAICHKGKIVGSYRKQNLPNVEVFDEVRNFGGSVKMTSSVHESGTDRVAEIASRPECEDFTIIVNIQCDEPFIKKSF